MTQRRPVKPGQPVRNSQSGQPIMVALDLLGRRWALRILWCLRHQQRKSTRALQQECGISSPNVLMSRLKELREAGIVALEESNGYALTELGGQLMESLGPLAEWADEWARQSGREDLACYGRAISAGKSKE
ncbi:winged helix-turn-helix transcriptional regulator [Alcanivorax sp.]|uniref:winged helix-turn-helix transcriptional regulator n=1 Tax=Alcanivorax sp. TaxID=1872427 RepID=UPI003A92A5E2